MCQKSLEKAKNVPEKPRKGQKCAKKASEKMKSASEKTDFWVPSTDSAPSNPQRSVSLSHAKGL
jgi:hypothetical protein